MENITNTTKEEIAYLSNKELTSNEVLDKNIEEIANEINQRELYRRKDNTDLPSYQVMLRTKLSNGKYGHFFEWIEPNMVRLRNL